MYSTYIFGQIPIVNRGWHLEKLKKITILQKVKDFYSFLAKGQLPLPTLTKFNAVTALFPQNE